ncbi:MAG: NAD-dependent epimerase/dehydratase [Candidatus Angelobacter sp.]|nr:NAD-dependent epimerase/dehydratase [Candidatus Angelobacter sp.]
MHANGHGRYILIFGGAGFIGSNWASRLLEETEAKIHIFDNLSREGSRHNLEWLERKAKKSRRLEITIGDVRNAKLVERAVRTASEIYQFAAQVAVTTSVKDPRLDFEVNTLGTLNVLEAARLHGRKPFLLFTSTNKVYGSCGESTERSEMGTSEAQPLDFHSPYGCSKGAADQYVRDYARIYGIPTIVLRMSCIAGPRQFGNEDQGWVAHFLYSALQDTPITLYGDGQQVRDVLNVQDLLHAFELVRENLPRTAGSVYNIGGGPRNAESLLAVIERIKALTGKQLDFTNAGSRPGDQQLYVTDFSKLNRDTGWKPEINLDATMVSIYQWWKSNRDLLIQPAARVPVRPLIVLQPVTARAV